MDSSRETGIEGVRRGRGNRHFLAVAYRVYGMELTKLIESLSAGLGVISRDKRSFEIDDTAVKVTASKHGFVHADGQLCSAPGPGFVSSTCTGRARLNPFRDCMRSLLARTFASALCFWSPSCPAHTAISPPPQPCCSRWTTRSQN